MNKADGSAKDGDEAGKEETDTAGTEAAVRRGELKADGGGERTKGIERIHQVAAGLEETSEGDDQPAAGGEKSDDFDGGEADALEEIQKIQQGCVGFVRRQSRLEFGHYGEKESVIRFVFRVIPPADHPILTQGQQGKGFAIEGPRVTI